MRRLTVIALCLLFAGPSWSCEQPPPVPPDEPQAEPQPEKPRPEEPDKPPITKENNKAEEGQPE